MLVSRPQLLYVFLKHQLDPSFALTEDKFLGQHGLQIPDWSPHIVWKVENSKAICFSEGRPGMGGAAGPSPPPPALHGAPHHHGFLGWKKVAVIPAARWHGVPQAGAVGGLSSQVCPGSPDLVLGPEMQLFGASVHLGVTAEPAPTELGPGWSEPGWYCKGVL